MKKTILAGVMVVAFCITWWVVAGEALQARTRSQQAFKQAWEAYGEVGDREQYNEHQQKEYEQAPQKFEPTFPQAYGEARKEVEQAYKQAQQAIEQATQASSTARAHYDTQFKWGIGAGLLVDVLLLVGVLVKRNVILWFQQVFKTRLSKVLGSIFAVVFTVEFFLKADTDSNHRKIWEGILSGGWHGAVAVLMVLAGVVLWKLATKDAPKT